MELMKLMEFANLVMLIVWDVINLENVLNVILLLNYSMENVLISVLKELTPILLFLIIIKSISNALTAILPATLAVDLNKMIACHAIQHEWIMILSSKGNVWAIAQWVLSSELKLASYVGKTANPAVTLWI